VTGGALISAPVEKITVVVIAAVLGLIFGSFVTALSYRLPRGEKVSHGRSRCPHCGTPLTIRDLVPLLSWLFSRGACRHCGAAISVRYPVIESLSLALFVTSAVVVHSLPHLALVLAFVPLLLALAVIDFEHQTVPNLLVMILVPLSVLWRWHADGGLLAGVAAGIVTLACVVGIGLLFRGATGASGIGFGDTKFIALGALAFPPLVFFSFLALASLAGIALGMWWRRRTGQERFPFAVTIALAWWVCLVTPLPFHA
jgi:leader peptidase (prepilin peptidase)/N-methyltransferase